MFPPQKTVNLFLVAISFAFMIFGMYVLNTRLNVFPPQNCGTTSKAISFTDLIEKSGLLEPNHPVITKYISQHHLFPPTFANYNLKYDGITSNVNYSQEMPETVYKLLGKKKNGFFVECGANDGIFLSNTLHLELEYGWNGLLVEADPRPLSILKSRNRRAWISDVCLSTKNQPDTVDMYRHKNWEALSVIDSFADNRNKQEYEAFKVPCFPIFSILSALNVSTVDYFSLDIEGAELAVLKTIPFSSIRIKILSIENNQRSEEVKNFLSSAGYSLETTLKSKSGFMDDNIFVHRSVNYNQR